MAVAIVQSRLLNHSLIPANAAVQLDSDAKVGKPASHCRAPQKILTILDLEKPALNLSHFSS